MRKGQIAGNQKCLLAEENERVTNIFPFPTLFSKAFSSGASWSGKGLNQYHECSVKMSPDISQKLCTIQHLTLYQMTKFLDLSELKGFTDNKSKMAGMVEFFSWSSRKYCWKGRKCWAPVFSPFPTVFSEVFFTRVVKTCYCVVYPVLLFGKGLIEKWKTYPLTLTCLFRWLLQWLFVWVPIQWNWEAAMWVPETSFRMPGSSSLFQKL